MEDTSAIPQVSPSISDESSPTIPMQKKPDRQILFIILAIALIVIAVCSFLAYVTLNKINTPESNATLLSPTPTYTVTNTLDVANWWSYLASKEYSLDEGHVASLSPDKKYVMFSYFDGPREEVGNLKTALLDTTTSDISVLPTFGDGAAWSPDGIYLAYQDSWSKNERGLWMINLLTKKGVRVVNTVSMDATIFNEITWSPDSTVITFSREVLWGATAPNPMSTEEKQEEELQGKWSVTRDGTDLKRITNTP